MQAQGQQTATSDQGQAELEEMVVTGTAVARTATDVPLAVTSFAEDDLRKFAGIGQADILRTVPGINVEGGGGEAAFLFVVCPRLVSNSSHQFNMTVFQFLIRQA